MVLFFTLISIVKERITCFDFWKQNNSRLNNTTITFRTQKGKRLKLDTSENISSCYALLFRTRRRDRQLACSCPITRPSLVFSLWYIICTSSQITDSINGSPKWALLFTLLVSLSENDQRKMYKVWQLGSSGHSGRFGHEFLGKRGSVLSLYTISSHPKNSTFAPWTMAEAPQHVMQTTQITETTHWSAKKVSCMS